MGENGADVLLLVNVGTDVAPVYEVVGSQRNVSFEETTEEIDVSSKTEGRAKRVLPGRYGATVSLDGLWVPDDEAFLALKAANRNGELIKIRKSEFDVETEEADMLITSMSDEYPDQDGATITLAGTIDGEWSEVSS